MVQALGEILNHGVKNTSLFVGSPRRDAQHDDGDGTSDQETEDPANSSVCRFPREDRTGCVRDNEGALVRFSP